MGKPKDGQATDSPRKIAIQRRNRVERKRERRCSRSLGKRHILTFHERGSWQVRQDQNMTFSNTFRWTLDRRAGMISLEHLRLGPSCPVFLFHLAPTGSNRLASMDSHLCEEDAYLAQVHGIVIAFALMARDRP